MSEKRVVYVPSNFEFLEPGRPEVGYLSDLSPEAKERLAPQIEAQRKRAASGKPCGPPWRLHLPDGTIEVVGGPQDETSAPSDSL